VRKIPLEIMPIGDFFEFTSLMPAEQKMCHLFQNFIIGIFVGKVNLHYVVSSYYFSDLESVSYVSGWVCGSRLPTLAPSAPRHARVSVMFVTSH
jgi:hypothetical protein